MLLSTLLKAKQRFKMKSSDQLADKCVELLWVVNTEKLKIKLKYSSEVQFLK